MANAPLVGQTDTTAAEIVPVSRDGDLVNLNTCRELLDSVGKDVLTTIVADYLDLLGTSSAVFEKSGDYALGTLTSGWCRLLDQASRALCATDDNREALACGQWLCHESCWTDASKIAIESGRSVDVECRGGLRLFAVPIWAGDEIVGSVNFGYGDPPQESGTLTRLAEQYRVEPDRLRTEAESYHSRPPYLIENAKKRLLNAAKLIGLMVERARVERVLKVVEDISARKRMERELTDMARFPTENPYPVLRVAKSGEILYANAAARSLLDDSRGGAGDLSVAQWRRRSAEALESGARQIIEILDGERIISFLVVPITGTEYANWYGRDVTEQRNAERRARETQQALLERQRDETARIAAELEKAREELLRKTRLATIGQVSANIAHDLRNPLGSVRNAAFYLKRHVPPDPPKLIEFLRIIEDEVANADRIIEGLLELTRGRLPDKRAVDVGQLATRVLHQIPERAGVRCQIAADPDPFLVDADLDQLRQVLINLARNAVQAMEGNGELWIEARRGAERDEIIVRDTGPGIPADVRTRLFEPLMTTKAKGSGLGLTICRQLIERHGGTIELVDDAGGGAAFRILLPRASRCLSQE